MTVRAWIPAALLAAVVGISSPAIADGGKPTVTKEVNESTDVQRPAYRSLQAIGYSRVDAHLIVDAADSVTRQSDGRVSGQAAIDVARGILASARRYTELAKTCGEAGTGDASSAEIIDRD